MFRVAVILCPRVRRPERVPPPTSGEWKVIVKKKIRLTAIALALLFGVVAFGGGVDVEAQAFRHFADVECLPYGCRKGGVFFNCQVFVFHRSASSFLRRVTA